MEHSIEKFLERDAKGFLEPKRVTKQSLVLFGMSPLPTTKQKKKKPSL